MMRVTVVGAGAWGTALAKHLAEKQLAVSLWPMSRRWCTALRSSVKTRSIFPVCGLPATLTATNGLSEALTKLIVWFAVPSHVARPVLGRIDRCCRSPSFCQRHQGHRGDNVRPDDAGDATRCRPICGIPLMVPRAELRQRSQSGKPTALCLAPGPRPGETIQALFITPSFRVYADDDLIGVQLGGALKNVMALAAGVVDGLELGHNARAALITRGLAEMIRFGVAMGAIRERFTDSPGSGISF